MRLSDLRRGDVQALVDRLVGEGLSGSTVRNAINPLRAAIRYAIRREGLMTNATADLEFPEPGGRRERAATPAEARLLLDALDDTNRAIFATAFYAGLRRGELRALRVGDVRDLDGEGAASIRIERSWDDVEGEVAPKSKAGVREVPIPDTLRTILAEHVARTGRSGSALLFGRPRLLRSSRTLSGGARSARGRLQQSERSFADNRSRSSSSQSHCTSAATATRHSSMRRESQRRALTGTWGTAIGALPHATGTSSTASSPRTQQPWRGTSRALPPARSWLSVRHRK